MRTVIEVFGPDRLPVGLLEAATGVLVARYNGVGTWQLTVQARSVPAEVRAALETPGSGVRVTDADHPAAPAVLAGPMTKPVAAWGEDDPWGGKLTIDGVTWEQIVLGDRITYPAPGSAWTSQSATAVYRRPASGIGPAETQLRSFVNVNAGPGALVARRVSGLTLAADGGRGTNGAWTSGRENLLELAQRIAAVGQIGFRVDMAADGSLTFEVTEPVTRSGVYLSVDSGTIRSGTHTVEAPTCSRALVGTSTTGVEVADTTRETLWQRRIERYVDQSSVSDADEIDTAGTEALAEGAAGVGLTVSVRDTPDAVYGVDYALGDRVPYEQMVLGQGVTALGVITEVKITVEPGRTSVEPTIGDPVTAVAASTPSIYRRVRKLETRLKRKIAKG